MSEMNFPQKLSTLLLYPAIGGAYDIKGTVRPDETGVESDINW